MKKALTCFVFLLLSQNLWAQDAANTPMKANYAYYGFDPDIVTNYVKPTTEELGYVRVTMELMIMDKKYLDAASGSPSVLGRGRPGPGSSDRTRSPSPAGHRWGCAGCRPWRSRPGPGRPAGKTVKAVESSRKLLPGQGGCGI